MSNDKIDGEDENRKVIDDNESEEIGEEDLKNETTSSNGIGVYNETNEAYGGESEDKDGGNNADDERNGQENGTDDRENGTIDLKNKTNDFENHPNNQESTTNGQESTTNEPESNTNEPEDHLERQHHDKDNTSQPSINSNSSSDESSEASDDDEGEIDDDAEDVDDDEPIFKYSRLNGLPPSLFTRDAISTAIVSETFTAFATHNGMIYLMNPDMTPIRVYRAHRASILSLSTDGQYLASGSIDGTVVIGSIKDGKDIIAADFKRPVHSVSLSPIYSSSKSYLSGGMAGKVILSERNWLGKRIDTNLDQISDKDTSDDPITAIYWLKDNIALWMNSKGITVYNMSKRRTMSIIPRPDNSPRADLYQPRFYSPDSNRLFIAWANFIWCLKVTESHPNTTATGRSLLVSSAASTFSSATTEEQVTVEQFRQVPWLISGISAFDGDILALLCYFPPEQGSRRAKEKPELKLYDWSSGEETYADSLPINGYELLGLNDYHMVRLVNSSQIIFYIVAAKDTLVATQRDLNDKLQWLLDHDELKAAWEVANNIVDPQAREEIGIKYVRELVDEELWEEAAEFLNIVLQDVSVKISISKAATDWNTWAWEFIRAGKHHILGKWLPRDISLGSQLQTSIYMTVLLFYLDGVDRPIDQDIFVELCNLYPVELYDVEAIKSRLAEIVQNNHQSYRKLLYVLSQLCLQTGDSYQAAKHLLTLRDVSVLDMIEQYHLLPLLLPSIPDILTIELGSKENIGLIPIPIVREKTARSIKLSVESRHEVPPEKLVNELVNCDEDMDVIIFLYLEMLNKEDSYSGIHFGDLQVKLFAEFERSKLMAFLKRNNNYNINQAIEVCEQQGYSLELVYLLGKIGQNKRALNLIIDKLHDSDQAIEFCRSQNDQELWNDLIEFSKNKPLFIRSMLQNHAYLPSGDLIRIINGMAPDMEIEDLKKLILQIFEDNQAFVSLTTEALNIICSETQDYSLELRRLRQVGEMFDMEQGVDKRFDQVDLSKTLVITPDDEILNESQVIGKRAWNFINIGPPWSITWKLNHLSYIYKHLVG